MTKKIVAAVFGAVVLSGCSMSVPGAGVEKGSIWKSFDSGQTFASKSKVDEKRAISSADVLALSFNPQDTNKIYIGTVDNGIFKTVDGGETWTPIDFPPKKIYSFVLDRNDPDNRMFASGVLNNVGKIFRTDDAGQNWREVYSEPGTNAIMTVVAQHPRDTNVLFGGTSAGTMVKSVDGGETWKNIGASLDGPITQIAFDATQSMAVYALIYNKQLYFSSDGGMTWNDWEKEKSKNSSTSAAQASGLVSGQSDRGTPDSILSIIPDPSVSGTLYATKQGGLYRSRDFGKYWDKLNIIESAEKFPIRAMAVNPHDSNEIIFVAGNAFYKSKNAGETWSVTELGVDRSVSVIAYDPMHPETIYLALRKL
jgi:photosystem II stability/assembly factor-like uncharacterized protein